MSAPSPAAAESCDFCHAPLAEAHQHLLEQANRKIECVCDPCAILFSDSRQKYRRVPRRVKVLSDFLLSDAQWDLLTIPIGIATFIQSTDGLLNNPNFPNLPVALAIFRQALDSFSALITDAEDGGTKSITAKDKQRAEVIRLYTLLGHYVEGTCNNNPATFATSGFTAKSTTRTAPQPLAPAQFSSIDRGPNSGQAVVKVVSQTGAVAYDVHYAVEGSGGVLGPWTTVTLTSTKKVTISGLTPAGTYQFQVRALGKLGYTDWSALMIFIVA